MLALMKRSSGRGEGWKRVSIMPWGEWHHHPSPTCDHRGGKKKVKWFEELRVVGVVRKYLLTLSVNSLGEGGSFLSRLSPNSEKGGTLLS